MSKDISGCLPNEGDPFLPKMLNPDNKFDPQNQTNLEVGCGLGKGEDAFAVGVKAAREALACIHLHDIVTAFVFASVLYNLEELLQGIHSVLGEVPVVGATTAGEIYNEPHQKSVVVLALASPYLKVRIGVGEGVSKNWRNAVAQAVDGTELKPFFSPQDSTIWQNLTLQGKSALGIIFSPGNTHHADSHAFEILEELKRCSQGRLPLIGGAAADDWRMEANYVLWGRHAYADSLLVAVFETHLRFGISLAHGFHPSPRRATVTHARGHEVLELDGKPAAEIYSQLQGTFREDLEGKHLTLATKKPVGIVGAYGQYCINVATYFTPTGGVRFAQPVPEGTILTIMEGEPDSLVTAGPEGLRKALLRGSLVDPAVALVFSCALRTKILGERTSEEIDGIRRMMPGLTVAGFYSFGEQGTADDGVNYHINEGISLLALDRNLSYSAQVALENEHLRLKAEQRTADLIAANRDLQREIIERQKAEEALHKAHQQLWALVQAAPLSIIVLNPEGLVMMWNPASESTFGWTEKEVIGRVLPSVPEDKMDEFRANLRRALAGESLRAMELRRRKKDGSPIDVSLFTTTLYDARGKVTGVMALQADITERKRSELALIKGYDTLEHRIQERTADLLRANETLQKEIIQHKLTINEAKGLENTLRESEERYRLLVSNIPAIVCKGYWNWEIDFFDDKIEEFLGYSKEEFNSRKLRWRDVVVEDDLPNMQRMFSEALKTNRSYIREYRVKTKEGKTIWVQERSQIVCSEDGKVDHISAVFFDITERRRAENDLRQAHAEIEQLFVSITAILIGLNSAGEVRHWNEEAEKVLQVAAPEALGQKLHKLPIQWESSKISEGIGGCRRKCQSIRVENVRFRRPDGKNGFLGVTVSPIKDEAGGVSGLILLGRDITERLILENQLAQAQKLESIGQLAAGIAHEINTPIQYVGDNTRFLGDAFKDLFQLQEEYRRLLEACKTGAVAADLLHQVETLGREVDLDYLMDEIPVAIRQSMEGVERVAKIVHAMKDFSHPGAVEKQAVDINKAIESTITVARNEWKYVAEMVTDLDPSLPLVSCRSDELNQVILNIIINAAHAIAEVVGREPAAKGTITIKTRRNGDGVEISISDTGGGIPEEIRSRIFDPFFTTKEVGKGTGQGLAICHSVIVDKHGGAINFETAMGQGTTFIISLPVGTIRPENG